jgi:hypothetical protein
MDVVDQVADKNFLPSKACSSRVYILLFVGVVVVVVVVVALLN